MTLLDTWPLRHGVAGALHPSVAIALRAKGDATIAMIIPARNEAATIADVVSKCRSLVDVGLVDELVVVDDGSSDATARLASTAGARVVANSSRAAITGPSTDARVRVDG
jgi:glucosyl-3-phosphoglycerate synthase